MFFFMVWINNRIRLRQENTILLSGQGVTTDVGAIDTMLDQFLVNTWQLHYGEYKPYPIMGVHAVNTKIATAPQAMLKKTKQKK